MHGYLGILRAPSRRWSGKVSTWIIAAILAATATAVAPALGQTAHPLPSTQPSPYRPLRYDEDWSFLKNGSDRNDFWDRLKYIPLGSDEFYLTLAGDLREQYELYDNYPALKNTANPNAVQYRGAFEQRYQFDVDAHATKYFRVFTQYESTFEDGRKPAPTTSDRDEGEVKQIFGDVKLPFAEDDSVTFRAGRQELYYGDGRVLTPGDTRNTRNVFDAVKTIVKLDDWQVDAFLSKPVTVRPGAFDDVENTGETLWAVYVTRPIPPSWLDGAKTSVDLYYFGNQFRSFTYNQGSGGEQRNTLGARWDGRAGPYDFDVEGNGQFGRFNEHDADAWLIAADGGYTFQNIDWTPRAGLRIDAESGDDRKSDPSLQTYQPLFSRGDWFGQSRFFAPSNLVDVHPTVDVYPIKGVDLTLGTDTFWRESKSDGIYRSVTEQLMVPDGGSRASYVGTLIEAQATWRINEHAAMLVSYAHLFAGQFLQSASTGKDLDYFAANFAYRF